MGFVIAFPGSARARNSQNAGKRQTTAEITIFPGVRYERYAAEPQKRDKAKHQRRFFDKMPQPG
ncbi:hypothetical protein [Phyllobacterium sp. YR531]|uniref:hypothetical protein n=1 Tax=Phyllobacterium sp. YR531 TaxID=1144343 RepID=UPI00026F901C|nr:hypothetical protein [Phyllobacterium sp. YR531]EJN01387.1 hypothetical protein PMI41_03469 [Phyllobacterium sp. YR531]